MAPVVLLDTVGELSKVYALASVAFVGGSIVDFGGHNPLEPAAYAKPVLMGPYSSNVREVAEDMERVGALYRVGNAEEIASLGLKFCTDQSFAKDAGSAAEKTWRKHQGATDRVVSLLEKIASELPDSENALRANTMR
jgi:3-deoxy-D-manno-octulosonic-acid transferase